MDWERDSLPRSRSNRPLTGAISSAITSDTAIWSVTGSAWTGGDWTGTDRTGADWACTDWTGMDWTGTGSVTASGDGGPASTTPCFGAAPGTAASSPTPGRPSTPGRSATGWSGFRPPGASEIPPPAW